MQDLWQAHDQNLSIILLKGLIKLNVKTMKPVEFNTKIVSAVLNIQAPKMIS